MSMRFLMVYAILIALCLPLTFLSAQLVDEITCINQYYHNWQSGVSDVVIRDNLAYVACDRDGFRILDISDLDNIRDLCHLPYDYTTAITIEGNYAYLGSIVDGVIIIDISNPESPNVIGTYAMQEIINEIVLKDNHAFICHHHGFAIVDISDKANPQYVWEDRQMIFCTGEMKLIGDTAYVAAATPGFTVLDISDISSPQIVRSYNPGNGDWVNGVDLYGNYACLACGWSGFDVVDLSNMTRVARIDSLVYAFRVEVVDDHAYLSYGDPECPLAIIDISEPASLQVDGIYYPPENMVNFEIVDDKAYIADYNHGLRMVDISNSFEPVEIHAYSRYGLDRDVIVKGNYAYVRENLKLKIIDITDMQNPFEVGYYEMPWDYNDFAMVGDVVYLVMHSDSAVRAVDVSNPSEPALLDVFVDENEAHYAISVYGDYAYVSRNQGIKIIDISDPENMQDAGVFNDEYLGNTKIGICGHYLFAAGNMSCRDIRVFDLTDPSMPEYVTSYDLGSGLNRLKVFDDKLFVSSNQRMFIFDSNDFTPWQPLGVMPVFVEDGWITDYEVSGDLIYTTSSQDGLNVFKMSDYDTAERIGHYETPGIARGLCVIGKIAIVADEDNLGFYDCTGLTSVDDFTSTLPESIKLLSNYPNPFNGSTNIQLTLATAGHVQLDIYDVLGRKVVNLANQQMNAGSNQFNWRGMDNNGQAVASGRYYITAKIDDRVESIPVLLLK